MIRIAIQNKGRLSDDSTTLLNHAGVYFDNAKRKYLVKSRSFPAEVLYLRDDDIPATVESGAAQLGIVGRNEVAESGAEVKVLKNLGFGFCRLCLAIPKNEVYQGPGYFNGKRVATSYPKILRRYFDSIGVTANIMFISGSVEITPSAGMADAIFDIVSSGGTLISNGLKEVETVMDSEAVLIANRELDADNLALAGELLARIESVCITRDKKYILMNIPTDRLPEAIEILPAMRSPTVIPLAAEGWCSLHSVVEAGELWDKVNMLKQIGAEGILVLNVDKIIL